MILEPLINEKPSQRDLPIDEKFSFLLDAHSKQINKSLNLYFKKKKMWETSEGELLNNFDFHYFGNFENFEN